MLPLHKDVPLAVAVVVLLSGFDLAERLSGFVQVVARLFEFVVVVA